MSDINRRKFLKGAVATGVTASLAASGASAKSLSKLSEQKSVMELAAPKLDTVRVGFIGVGQRGYWHVKTMCTLDGVEIKAICDTHQKVLDRAVKHVVDSGFERPSAYTGSEHSYRDMLERDDIDMVIISTPWKWHVPMSVETMESGKHAFVEVPAALTVDECWKLVETSERTQLNCMMLENVCYGRDELMVLNMARQGLFGELLHGEAAYIHELRWQMKEVEHKTGSWRTDWHAKRRGNLYPTHGLGPIAQYMNINRGDRMDYLSSVDSPAMGRQIYAQENFPKEHKRNQATYITGDINTSIIKTVKGRTIMLQHDTTTPRPYSRHNLIQGTEGAFAGFPNRIALENSGNYHEWDYEMDKWYKKYDHPLWTKLEKDAQENGGHGGMDFVMMWRIIYCLRNGVPLDQNVYDAAAWSCINHLSHESVTNRSQTMNIPDFTRGLWEVAQPLNIKA
ncbi:Gfo/Idh/MocA family protein [Kangiella shandongensis]|uniref:Gfo/Idh/MocA family protein n=1 Tax=Kangiella shandongensis TaxID=2763258 RepID=UPI001CBDE9B9|nr:Gfo/Idh/MocA family oxidoreductase [Kangiella shandongensis]